MGWRLFGRSFESDIEKGEIMFFIMILSILIIFYLVGCFRCGYMNYFYIDLYAIRFRLKSGGINCFWKDLFLGIHFIKEELHWHRLTINYARFYMFWEDLLTGIKGLYTGKVFW